MRIFLLCFGILLTACVNGEAPPPPGQVAAYAVPPEARGERVYWYSEQVRVAGLAFRPKGPAPPGGRPGVVLAPGWGRTAESLQSYAVELARAGLVALVIDYRGQGASGGRIYLAERVDVYDAMRFSEHDVTVAIRRGLLDPEAQVQDIRNAVTFLQGEPGVDRRRIGVLGEDIAGGHVVSVMGLDARIRAGMAVAATIPGHDETPLAFDPDPATLSEMIRLAREGAPPHSHAEALERNDLESRLLLREYKPFWRIKGIAPDALVGFLPDRKRPEKTPEDVIAAVEVLGARARLLTYAEGKSAPAKAAEFFVRSLGDRS